MSESAPRNTSEPTSEKNSYIATAPFALQLDQLDKVAGYDDLLADEFEREACQGDFDAYRKQRIRNLLAVNGIREPDSDAAAAEHAKYWHIRDIYEQVAKHTKEEWQPSEVSADTTPRDMMFRQISAEYSDRESQPSHEGSTDDEGSQEDDSSGSVEADNHDTSDTNDTDTTNLDELSNRLGEARTKLAELDAKRAGRAFSFGKDKHNELRGQYDELVQQLGREKLKDVLADDNLSPQDKNLKVVEYILGQQKELREATIENMKNSKVGKFVNWMNKGSVKVRFIKGITIGVAAGALGTLLAGATGAAAIAVTTTAAARFVKGYASSEGKTGTKMTSEMSQEDRDSIMKHLNDGHYDNVARDKEIEETKEMYRKAKQDYSASVNESNLDAVKIANETKANIDEQEKASIAAITRAYDKSLRKDRLTDALNQSRSIDERDIKKEQKGRRRSLAMGAVAVGLGAAVTGIGAEYVRDHLHDIPQLWHPFDTPVGATKPPTDITDNGGTSGGGAGGNTLSGMPDPSSIDTFVDNLSAEAHTVMPGEGWNQTMLDMGIPKDHWNSILTQAGPELQNQGWAYFDNAHGEWRISQPGQLPNDVLRTIADYAQRDGYTLGA